VRWPLTQPHSLSLTGRVPGTVRDYGQGLGIRGQLLDWPGQGPVPGPWCITAAYMWHSPGLLALAPPCHLISDAPRPGFNVQTTNSDLEVRNLRYKTNELEAKLEPDLMMHPISCLGG
jgi:hypothetical protein